MPVKDAMSVAYLEGTRASEDKAGAARGASNAVVLAKRATYTFCSARRPKMPVGRMSIVTIRIPNTIRSEYFSEM